MAFIEIDTDLCDIIEEGAKRKMEVGGDARIAIGSDAGIGPAFYYVAASTNEIGKLLKIWSETTANKSKYEYSENVAAANTDGIAWLTASGGSITTMMTHVPA